MATATAYSTVVGVFNTRDAAERAVRDLRAAGYSDDHIGLIARNADGTTSKENGKGETLVDEGAMLGASAGAIGGALVGAGVVAGVIPVVGPVLAIGTLGTVLLNAVGGAAIAGLAGALIGWGIPEEDARFYEEEVKAGRFLVTVNAGDRYDHGRSILDRNGAYDRLTRPEM